MNLDMIRVWKDEDYRESLTAEEFSRLTENPAGLIELTDEELGAVEGALLPHNLMLFTISTHLIFTYGLLCMEI